MTEDQSNIRLKYVNYFNEFLRILSTDQYTNVYHTLEKHIHHLSSELAKEGADDKFFWTPSSIADLAMKQFEDRMSRKGLPGYSTGIDKLDDMIGGFEPQNIYNINARPGIGKTTILLQFLWKLQKETTVLYCSPEARAQLLSMRLACALSSVPMKAVRRGDVTTEQHKRYQRAKEQISSSQLFFYDMPSVSAEQVERQIKHTEHETGTKVGAIGLDYLQQMAGEDSFTEITNNMKKLEELTILNDVATIMASQVGRASGDGSSQDAGKGSGKIEELASVVMGFIPVEPDPKSLPDPDDKLRRVLVCSKNRMEGTHFKIGLKYNDLTGWYEVDDFI